MPEKKLGKYSIGTEPTWLKNAHYFVRNINIIKNITRNTFDGFPFQVREMFYDENIENDPVVSIKNGTWFGGDWEGGILENVSWLSGKILGNTYMKNCLILTDNFHAQALTIIHNSTIKGITAQLEESIQENVNYKNVKLVNSSIVGLHNRNEIFGNNILFTNSTLINSTVSNSELEKSSIYDSMLDTVITENCTLNKSYVYEGVVDECILFNSTCSKCETRKNKIKGGKYINSTAIDCEWSGGLWDGGTWYSGNWKRGLWSEGIINISIYDKHNKALSLFIKSYVQPTKVLSFLETILGSELLKMNKLGKTVIIYKEELDSNKAMNIIKRIQNNKFYVYEYSLK